MDIIQPTEEITQSASKYVMLDLLLLASCLLAIFIGAALFFF